VLKVSLNSNQSINQSLLFPSLPLTPSLFVPLNLCEASRFIPPIRKSPLDKLLGYRGLNDFVGVCTPAIARTLGCSYCEKITVCVCVCVCVCVPVTVWMYIVGLCRQCTLLFSLIAVDLLSDTDAVHFNNHSMHLRRLIMMI